MHDISLSGVDELRLFLWQPLELLPVLPVLAAPIQILTSCKAAAKL